MLSVLLAILATVSLAWAAPASQQEVTCAFADGRGMRVQYTPVDYKLQDGEVWTPGNQPVALFLDTGVTIAGNTLPAGAYGVYVEPEKHDWKLIVNQSAKGAAEYDNHKDVVRAAMDAGDLGHKVQEPQFALGHTGPSQCTLRIYAGSTMAWEDIQERGK